MQEFNLTVDYSLTHKDMIRMNGFNSMDYKNVTERRFPFPVNLRGTKVVLPCALFHYPKGITSVGAICDMVQKGFRPATFTELLSIQQGQRKIAGLGTYYTDGFSRRWTPIFYVLKYGTHLCVHDFDVKWDSDFLFLAVRND